MSVRKRLGRAGVAAAAVVGLTLGSCSLAYADQQIDNFVQEIPQGDNYVAIGDSFTVSGAYQDIAPDPCLRNVRDYPHLVSAALNLPLLEPACSGALTTQYWEQGIAWQTEVDKSPMRDSITKKTKLVTLSLGANNVDKDWDGETNTPEKCIVYILLHGSDPHYSVCEREFGASMAYWMKGLKKELVKMYKDAVDRAADDAVVIAVGYFPLFDSKGSTCYDTFYVPVPERHWGHKLFTEINATVEAAAKEVGIPYYNPSKDPVVDQHGPCAKPGERFVTVSGFPEFSLLVHPTVKGQSYMAKKILQVYHAARVDKSLLAA